MDGPTPSTHRPLSDPLVRSATPGSDRAGAPGSDRAEAPGSDRAQAPALVHLRRPDGRLQVGLGPRAWLVQGWPSTRSSAAGEAAASGLVRALAGAGGTSAGVGASLPPYRVVGHGVLAHRVRTHLAVGGAESDDGVVVLVSAYAVPVGTARQPDLAAAPVLPVVAQTHRVVIGPWAGLGRGPCLHCLDLHRTDADPAWPALAAALDDPATCPPPPRHTEDVVGLVTALTGLLLGGFRRDGRDEPGLAYEVGAQRPHLVLRRWSTHPACPWHRG